MARERDGDSASAAPDGQSKHRDSDAHSDVSSVAPQQHRLKQQHQKQHHVGGRLHARVPSAKVLHTKSHQHGQAAPRLTRRTTSPGDRESNRRPNNHRRVHSEAKLSRDGSSTNLPKSASQSSLKRNRSSIEVSKRNRSSDKLHRNSSSTAVNKHKSTKSQVTFDIGMDDPEDEWVDASGSNSPHMSRKGSLISSGQSSLQRNPVSNVNSRPQTPNDSAQPSTNTSPSEQERVRHKEYLTSRVLKRTTSQGATTQMATQIAQASLPRHSPESDGPNGSLSTSGNQDGLTSRFVETPGSGIVSEGSFYNPSGSSRQLPTISPRVHSSSSLSQNGTKHLISDIDNSALVPKAAGHNTAPRAETSRTQQKLNLQRQSSALEPGQAVGAVGGVAGPLIGITGGGYDGASSRDPRVNRLMERTGMEYLVVRRCQNPIARSLNRVGRLPDLERSKRIPRPGTPLANGKRTTPEAPARHTRNVSMPDPRQTATSRRVATIRSSGAGSSFEGDDAARLSERMSGSSATEETDDTATLLRNLWEKSMELSASTD
ncbi:hypothetical protein PWT90_06445 [Aphanocladium album]|nr:hypothetical protein PWT90_06445 [Aphanocladium album]